MQTSRHVYETIMRWLEEGGAANVPLSGRDILTVPILDAAEEAKVKHLRFRKVRVMGGGSYAESLDSAAVRINYDPNWEALHKIEALLSLGKL